MTHTERVLVSPANPSGNLKEGALNQPVKTDGDGDGGLYPQFDRTVQSLFSEYRDTTITICLEDVEAAVNTAYEYGARAPRAYARRIIEQQRTN